MNFGRILGRILRVLVQNGPENSTSVLGAQILRASMSVNRRVGFYVPLVCLRARGIGKYFCVPVCPSTDV